MNECAVKIASHKANAMSLPLGFFGKSNLLLTSRIGKDQAKEKIGVRFRLV